MIQKSSLPENPQTVSEVPTRDTMQVVIIAIGDAILRRAAITSRIATPTALLQAVFSCLLLAMVIAGILTGDMSV